MYGNYAYRFEDELVVVGEVEDGTRGPGIAQLTHRLVAEAHLEKKLQIKVFVRYIKRVQLQKLQILWHDLCIQCFASKFKTHFSLCSEWHEHLCQRVD